MTATSKLSVTTPSDREIVMARSFAAPRRLVWEAMTKPQLVQRWMFVPSGWSWAACEMDVSVGGKFRWAWNGPDGKLALVIWGEHLEVIPPTRIVHTEHMEMPSGGTCGPGQDVDASCEVVVTLELTERSGETHLKMTIVCPSQEVRDAMIASGMEHGVAAGYDALDAILAGEID